MGQQVRVYDLEKEEEKGGWSIVEGDSIMSLALTQDSKFLLVNLIKQQIHLWPLATGPLGRHHGEPLQVYEGLQERRGRCASSPHPTLHDTCIVQVFLCKWNAQQNTAERHLYTVSLGCLRQPQACMRRGSCLLLHVSNSCCEFAGEDNHIVPKPLKKIEERTRTNTCSNDLYS